MTPYYNKTTREGLVQHFKAITESAGLPCIVYNVPSRTGMNIDPETAYELAKNPLICGIKEASGNISQIAKTVALCGDELPLDVYKRQGVGSTRGRRQWPALKPSRFMAYLTGMGFTSQNRLLARLSSSSCRAALS